MPRIAKLFLIEAAWCAVALAVGVYFWVLVASHDDNRTDAYWTAYGHQPPPGTFWSPDHLMPVLLFGPYVASVLIRLLASLRSSQVRVAAVALCSSLALGGVTPSPVAAQTSRATAPPAGGTDYYRVDMHIDQDGQRYVIRQYVDGTRSRMDTDVDGQTFIVIQLGDGPGTTYTLLPESRMAMKMTQQASAHAADEARHSRPAGAPAGAGQDAAAMELVGTDAVDGLTAQKYRVRMADVEGWVWLDATSQLPLRMEAAGAVVALRNYDFSKPPDDLFQVPKGYDVTDVDAMMPSVSMGRLVARGAVGAVGSSLGSQVGGNAGGSLGAGIGGALGGPVGAMVGHFLGQHFGKKAGTSAGAAAATAIP